MINVLFIYFICKFFKIKFLLFEYFNDDIDPDDPPIERFTAPFTGKAKFTLWVEADGIVRFSMEPVEGTAPKKSAQPGGDRMPPNSVPRTQSGAVNYTQIVKQVMARHYMEIGDKTKLSVDKLCRSMKVPSDERVLLAHDASVFNNGKTGYVLTNKGAYAKEPLAARVFTSWNAFASGQFSANPKGNDCLVDGKVVCYCNIGVAEAELKHYKFFEDLHQTIKNTR